MSYGLCLPRIASGQSCAGRGCQAGLVCDNSLCAAPPTPPAAVGPGQSCDGVPCRTGLACDQNALTCAAIIQQGGSCTSGAGLCEHLTSCVSGTCQPWPSTAGASCSQTGSPDDIGCLGGLTCVSGMCQVPFQSNPGCLCTASSECTGSECAPMTDATGAPLGPYLCKPDDGLPYDGCTTISCGSGFDCWTDSNGNEFCAVTCSSSSGCPGGTQCHSGTCANYLENCGTVPARTSGLGYCGP